VLERAALVQVSPPPVTLATDWAEPAGPASDTKARTSSLAEVVVVRLGDTTVEWVTASVVALWSAARAGALLDGLIPTATRFQASVVGEESPKLTMVPLVATGLVVLCTHWAEPSWVSSHWLTMVWPAFGLWLVAEVPS